MKKFILSALIALSTLSGAKAANLYSSNLGNGASLADAIVGIPSGTVRFGVFPDGFDFNANVSDFPALDEAFIEVASFSGDLSVNDVDGFYQSAITYDTSATYEGVSYADGIAGKKVYIWVLNSVVPAEVTQQLVVSTSQTWVAADAVIADTFATPDTGAAGLTLHIGSTGGNDIGAGAASHVLGGAQTEITTVTLTAAPSATVSAGTNVTLTAVSDGSPIKTYVWYKGDEVIQGVTGNTYTITGSAAADTGIYKVLVSNGPSSDIPSNTLALTVNTPKPTIVTQPVSTVVAVGDALNLSVVAVGEGDLKYQWKKGGSISGATTPELSLANLSLKEAGTYTVSVTNGPGAGTGTANSDKAEVVVVDQTPSTITTAVGGKATLTALTAGKGQSFQWFKVGSEEPLADGAKFKGVTKNKLSISGAQEADSGEYYCAVSVGEGTPVNSGLVTLNVFSSAPELDEVALALMPDAMIGATYEYQVPVLGGASQAPLTYAAKGLPSGLKIDSKTGFITGRPTKAADNVGITFTVANKIGKDTASATINVDSSEELADLAGSYVGPIERNSSGLPDGELGGRFEMTVSTLGSLSGKLYLGANIFPVKAVIELGGEVPSAEFTVLRKGGLPPLTVGFELEGDLLINGYITDSINDVNFDGYKNVYDKKNNPATDYQALYNFAMGLEEGNANVGDLDVPQGAGYGSFTVAADGKLSVKGKTADGESYTTSSFVGPSGEVFLFQTLYKTNPKGSIHGRMYIDPDNGNVIDGAATQLRPLDPSSKQRTYAAGFDLTDLDSALLIMGGAYTAPVSPLVLLNQAENTVAQLTFENGVGPVAADAEASLTLLAKNKLTVGANSAKTKVSINAKTGLILGSFKLSDNRAGKFTGVVIPEGDSTIGLGSLILPESADKTADILSSLMSIDASALPPPPCDL